jgi:glutathione reductase (NADPH)
MALKFDLVVIGTGAAASTVASSCRREGWSVAIVDSRPYGGTCALRGCDPKKVLVGAAEVIDWIGRMQGKGVTTTAARIDWPELIRFKRTFTDPVPKSREESFGKAGIKCFHGTAHFTGPHTLQMGSETVEAKHVAIACGAKPAKLGIGGEELLVTSDEFLELQELPRRIVFIGGGYISFEFAHIAARAGSSVVIVHLGNHGLELFDPDLVDRLVEWTREIGVRVELQTRVESIERSVSGLVVKASCDGFSKQYAADLVVHGAGRVPNIDDLDLARGEVEQEQRGVTVNEYLQSRSNPAVYAAGDCAASGNPPLTPVAGYEGKIVAANLIAGNRKKSNYGAIPSVVFTVPPIASVGLDESAARDQGLRFRTGKGDSSGWYSSRRIGETCAGYKILVEEETDRILGAHLLGSGAAEHINLFALAIHSGLRAGQIKDIIYSYPTHFSDTAYLIP